MITSTVNQILSFLTFLFRIEQNIDWQLYTNSNKILCFLVTGKVGELTMALLDLLWNDMVAGTGMQRIHVLYDE